MEQSSGKKERLILAAGLALALAAAAFQYFSPASRALAEGRDVTLALLGERSALLLVYHPFSDTVNAFVFPQFRYGRAAAAADRAAAVAAAALGQDDGGNVFYASLSGEPGLEALWEVLNSWRARPRLLWEAASGARALKASGATDLSGFDLFMVFSEFLRLGSSNFILTEVPRRGRSQDQARPDQEEAAPPAAGPYTVEVFNASGRAGLAASTAKRLRSLGFDVITEGNHRTIEKDTRIIGFSGDTQAALRLRAALGLEEQEIRVNTSVKSVAGAAVILGQDFRGEKSGK